MSEVSPIELFGQAHQAAARRLWRFLHSTPHEIRYEISVMPRAMSPEYCASTPGLCAVFTTRIAGKKLAYSSTMAVEDIEKMGYAAAARFMLKDSADPFYAKEVLRCANSAS